MFLLTVSRMVTKALTATKAVPAAAGESTDKRNAVVIYAVTDVYYGGEDVTASTGIKIPAGEREIIPVNNRRSVYVVGGNCVVADCF